MLCLLYDYYQMKEIAFNPSTLILPLCRTQKSLRRGRYDAVGRWPDLERHHGSMLGISYPPLYLYVDLPRKISYQLRIPVGMKWLVFPRRNKPIIDPWCRSRSGNQSAASFLPLLHAFAKNISNLTEFFFFFLKNASGTHRHSAVTKIISLMVESSPGSQNCFSSERSGFLEVENEHIQFLNVIPLTF